MYRRIPSAHCPLQCGAILKETHRPVPLIVGQCIEGGPMPNARYPLQCGSLSKEAPARYPLRRNTLLKDIHCPLPPGSVKKVLHRPIPTPMEQWCQKINVHHFLIIMFVSFVMEQWCQKINMHYFLVIKFVSFAINQPIAFKWLHLMEILVKWGRKIFLYPLPPPGVSCENEAVSRSRDFFFRPPTPSGPFLPHAPKT